MIRKTIYILLTFGIASIVILFSYINKTTELTQNLESDLKIFTSDFNSKKENLDFFNPFIENVVLFEARIRKIKYDKGVYTLLAYSKKVNQELICSFQSDQNSEIVKLNDGDMINVKGVYKGFLTNMIFQNCILN